VAAIIRVGPAPDYPLTFQAADPASANYLMNAGGDWDFSCFKQPIRVQLSIATPGVVFYVGHGKDTISFADDPTQPRAPPRPGHHQFPGGVHHVTAQSTWFRYRNDWDCGAGDGKPRCLKSAYGVYLGDAGGGFLGEPDPIIQNGGGQE
jgi:hypothetical protein